MSALARHSLNPISADPHVLSFHAYKMNPNPSPNPNPNPNNPNKVPDKVHWWARGLALLAESTYHYFDGNTANDWPVHDPCGTSSPNQKKGVSNPGGQIYLR